MWQYHSDQLLRIITHRRQAYGVETYGFIVWTICSIDISALLSVSGTGVFVESLREQNMIPPPERCLPHLLPGQSAAIYPEQEGFFPKILTLNQDVLLLAFEVGKLAQDLRQEHQSQLVSEPAFHINRRARIEHLQRQMEHSRDIWRSQYPDYWTWLSEPRPPRVFASIAHVRISSYTTEVVLTKSGSLSHFSVPASYTLIRVCIRINYSIHFLTSISKSTPA